MKIFKKVTRTGTNFINHFSDTSLQRVFAHPLQNRKYFQMLLHLNWVVDQVKLRHIGDKSLTLHIFCIWRKGNNNISAREKNQSSWPQKTKARNIYICQKKEKKTRSTTCKMNVRIGKRIWKRNWKQGLVCIYPQPHFLLSLCQQFLFSDYNWRN